MTDLETFLAGMAPDHVAIGVADDAVDDPTALDDHAEVLDWGRAIVVGGAAGRRVFDRLAGEDPMDFAMAAGDREGDVARDLSGADCPDADGGRHDPRVVFAFAEARNEAVGGLYAEGPVVHAYVECSCGTRYGDRWVVGG